MIEFEYQNDIGLEDNGNDGELEIEFIGEDEAPITNEKNTPSSNTEALLDKNDEGDDLVNGHVSDEEMGAFQDGDLEQGSENVEDNNENKKTKDHIQKLNSRKPTNNLAAELIDTETKGEKIKSLSKMASKNSDSKDTVGSEEESDDGPEKSTDMSSNITPVKQQSDRKPMESDDATEKCNADNSAHEKDNETDNRVENNISAVSSKDSVENGSKKDDNLVNNTETEGVSSNAVGVSSDAIDVAEADVDINEKGD